MLVADPFEHGLVFLCALGPPAEDDDEDDDEVPELGWIAVDGDGLALADARRVQEAAMLAALCETAEEAALVPDAAEIAAAVERALALAGDERARAARRARGDPRGGAAPRPSTATACASRARGYVDQLADAARAPRRERAGAAAARRGALGEPQRRGRATRPSRSRAPSGTCSTASRPRARRSASATRSATPRRPSRPFAEDVLAHYRADLDDDAEAGHDHV